MTIIPVILSGGSGTRLWPLSREEHPKQFLSLVGQNSMIQETLLRLKGLKTSSPIVVCGEKHRFLVAEQIKNCDFGMNCSDVNIMLEPCAKNTAPAITAACYLAKKIDNEAVVIILPSDHVIKKVDEFQKALKLAVKTAQDGFLVTFGIVPTFASTGYGYIKTSISGDDLDVLDLTKFVEKPDLQTAQQYLSSGEYCWNSGMFVFKASTFIDELNFFDSKMNALVKKSFINSKNDDDFIRLGKSEFEQITGNSIDYAVMEHTKKGKVIRLNAGWNDVGSWSALYDIQEKDENQNVLKGNVVALETKNSYIHAQNRKIATIGLDNIVIVDSNDAILIASKDKIQDVKKLV